LKRDAHGDKIAVDAVANCDCVCKCDITEDYSTASKYLTQKEADYDTLIRLPANDFLSRLFTAYFLTGSGWCKRKIFFCVPIPFPCIENPTDFLPCKTLRGKSFERGFFYVFD